MAHQARILFLDDMEERHNSFSRVTIGTVLDHVWDAAGAISSLREYEYDQVFLDHDLSERDIMVIVGQPSHVPTGMTVVEHIMQMDRPPMDIVVHSCNEPAAIAMQLRLEEHPARPRVRRVSFPLLISLLRQAQAQDR